MAPQTYILCPGQGAQAVGMGKSLFDASPMAKETLEQADAVLDFSLSSICFNGPEERLNQTDISQPAIYATSIASYRAGIEAGVIDPTAIAAFAGLSRKPPSLRRAGWLRFLERTKRRAASCALRP
jgi:malonyl CoA-acyl carrier protein transacylase